MALCSVLGGLSLRSIARRATSQFSVAIAFNAESSHLASHADGTPLSV